MANSFFVFLTLMVLAHWSGLSQEAHGFGSKPVSSNPPACGGGETGWTTANPIRKVRLKKMSTQNFHLPNGQSIDFSTDINTMFQSSVTNSGTFAPFDGTSANECDYWIELRGGVTSFVLNAFEMGISFGYSPSGETGSGITSIQGKTKVRVGNIAMDFSVWECSSKGCSSIAATTASNLTTGYELNADIDFSEVKTATALIYQTPVGTLLRNIMTEGMKEVAHSERLSELSWSARVKEVFPTQGTFIMDAGSRSHILPFQTFSVYAAPSSGSACSVYQAIARAHTTEVEPVSSTLQIDRSMGTRPVKSGDIIMIRPAGTSE